MRIIIFLSITFSLICIECIKLNAVFSQDCINKLKYAQIFSRIFKLHEASYSIYHDLDYKKKDHRLLASLRYAVPKKFLKNGKQWFAHPYDTVDLEGLFQSVVIYSGVPLVSEKDVNEILDNNEIDIQKLHYSNKSKIYLATLLHYGFQPQLIQKNHCVSENETIFYLKQLKQKLKKIKDKIVEPVDSIFITNFKRFLRQTYFPDGPISQLFHVKYIVPNYANFHQYAAILGNIELNSNNTYAAIGLWGAASSRVSNGRVWGAFLQATNDYEKDSQLIGLEIDVINNGLVGRYPNKAKVGLQLVSMGMNNTTAAIQVLSDHSARWENGILFEDKSLANDGTLIGLTHRDNLKNGIDLSLGNFSDSAVKIGNDNYLTFKCNSDKQKDCNPATLKNDKNNFLVIHTAANGLIIKDNYNKRDILHIDKFGNVILLEGAHLIFTINKKKYVIQIGENGTLYAKKINDPK